MKGSVCYTPYSPVEDTMIYFNSTSLIKVYLALPLIPSSFLAPDCIFLHAFSTMLSLSPLDPCLVCKPLKCGSFQE